MRMNFQDRLLFFLILTLCLLSLSKAATASCKLVSPTSYKVSSGTTNFIFTLQMESKYVNDQNSHDCQYGIMIQDLMCADYVQTECCCNSITKISKVVCKVNQPITQNLQFEYIGLADVANAAIGGICSGIISISIQQDKSSGNIQLIIGIIIGILLFAGVGFFIYKKKSKAKKVDQQKQNMKDPFLQSQKQKKSENIQKKQIIQQQKEQLNISERDKRILIQRLKKQLQVQKPQKYKNYENCQKQKKQQIKEQYSDKNSLPSSYKVQPKIQKPKDKIIDYKIYQDDEDFKKWKNEQYLKERENDRKKYLNQNKNYEKFTTPINYRENNQTSYKYQQYETQGKKKMTKQQQFILFQKKLQAERFAKLKLKSKESSGIYQHQERQHVTIDFPQNFHLNVTPSQIKKDQKLQETNKPLSDVDFAKMYRQSLIRMKN